MLLRSDIVKGVLSGMYMLHMQIFLSSSIVVAIASRWVLIMTSLLSMLFLMNVATPPLALFASVLFLKYPVKFFKFGWW